MAHHRANVAQVDLPGCKVALPAHYVEGIEGIEDLGVFALAADADLPLTILLFVMLHGWWLGYGDGRRIVERVLAQQAVDRADQTPPSTG